MTKYSKRGYKIAMDRLRDSRKRRLRDFIKPWLRMQLRDFIKPWLRMRLRDFMQCGCGS